MDDDHLITQLNNLTQKLKDYDHQRQNLAFHTPSIELAKAINQTVICALVLLPPQPSGSSQACPNCGHSLTVTVNVT